MDDKTETHEGADTQQYKDENQFLKDSIVRLTKELLVLQNEHGSNKENTTNDVKIEGGIEVPPWMMDSSIMSPLFTAYDMRIKQLSSFIEHQGSYLDKLTTSVRSLTMENKNTRERSNLQEGVENIIQAKHDKYDGANNQLQMYEDKILLEQQAELLVEELDNANRCLSSRDNCISELTEELQSKLNFVKSLSNKNTRLSDEKRASEQTLLESLEQVASSKNLADDLTKRLKELERHQSSIVSESNIAKSERKESEQRNDELHDEMIKLSTTSVQDLQQKLVSMSSSYERVNAEYLGQTKELDSFKNETERLQKDLSRYRMHQNDLIQSNFTIAGGRCFTGSSFDKVRELEITRDKLDAKVISLEQQINQLNDRSTRLMEIIGLDTNFSAMNSQHAFEIENKDNLLMEHKLKATEMQFKIACQERKLEDALAGKAKLNAILQTERDSRVLGELKQSLQIVSEDLQTEQKERNEAIDHARHLKSEMAKMSNLVATLRNDQEAIHRDEKNKIQEWKETQSKQQSVIDDLKSKSHNARIESEELLRISKEVARKSEIDLKSTILEIERKAEEKDISTTEASAALQDTRTALEALRKQYSDEHKKIKSSIEGLATNFRKCNENLEVKIRDISAECYCLTDEKLALSTFLKRKEKESDKLSLEIARSERKHVSLGRQLGQSLKDQKARIEREKALKMENNTLKMKYHDLGGGVGDPTLWPFGR